MSSSVRFYHGTSSVGEALALDRGEIRPLCPSEIAAKIECEFSLSAGVVLNSSAFEFSRGREEDPHVYLTQDLRVAQSYASAGSEVISDAVGAAYHELERLRRGNLDDVEQKPFYEAKRRFVVAWRALHAIEPRIIELDVPMEAIASSPGFLSYIEASRHRATGPTSVDGWLELVSPINTLQLVGSVPLAWRAAARLRGVEAGKEAAGPSTV